MRQYIDTNNNNNTTMRFTISSTTLSNKLNALAKVINVKSPTPILADILFDIHDNTLFLTASDSENTMVTSLPVGESDGSMTFAINCKNILDAVKSFSEQPITFELDTNSNIVNIMYLNGHFSMPTDDANTYPETDKINEGYTELTISSNLLAENINRSLFATAQDELRPQMNGIYFDLTPECLAVVASDGHKLVRNKLFSVLCNEQRAFILPKKPATLLKNMLDKDGDDVVIRFNERNASICFAENEVYCRLIEGRYPNYNSVIPTNNNNEITIDRESLLNAIKRVQPFANDSSNLIKFNVDATTLTLDAADFDFSKTATEKVACQYNGQPMNIGFKGVAFIEILSNFDCDEIIIKLADPSRAGLVVPAQQPENQDVQMLVMPMLIND